MNPDAINALKKENELVTILAAVASAFTALRASTELETEALGAWEPDLLRHKQINENSYWEGRCVRRVQNDGGRRARSFATIHRSS